MSSIDSTIARWLTDEPGYHPLVELIFTFLHSPEYHQVPAPPDGPWDLGQNVCCYYCIRQWRYGHCLPYLAVHCSRCGYSLPPPSEYWPVPPHLVQRVHLSRVLKLLLYSIFAPRLPVHCRPHDAATCPLCLLDTAFVLRWLTQDGREEMEDSIACAIGELHCFPEPTQAQRLQRGQRYSIDFGDLDFPRTFVDSPTVPWSEGQRYGVGGYHLSGAALYEVEVQVDDWEVGQLEVLRMHPRAWRFVLDGWLTIPRECRFWEWRLGVVAEVQQPPRVRLEHLEYRCG